MPLPVHLAHLRLPFPRGSLTDDIQISGEMTLTDDTPPADQAVRDHRCRADAKLYDHTLMALPRRAHGGGEGKGLLRR